MNNKLLAAFMLGIVFGAFFVTGIVLIVVVLK